MTKTSNASIFRRYAVAERQMLDLVMPWTPETHLELPARVVAEAKRVVVTVANNGTSRLVRRVVVAKSEV